ncbi:hypothetical protein GCM10020360_14390 [Nonlabens tegetincola]
MIFQWRKWNGSPHWRHECVYLGSDSWGDWVGQPTGWASARPGRAYTVGAPSVTLVPSRGDGSGFALAGIAQPDFSLTVNRGHRKGMRIYIDLGWDIRWQGEAGFEPDGDGEGAGGGAGGGAGAGVAGGAAGAPITLAPGRDDGTALAAGSGEVLATGIDMDLDVVRVEGPRGTWVDDRDEWAEHSVRYGYPRPVMDQLEALALDLEARVRAQTAPFDDATADAWLDRLEALGLER